ncbi:MAG: NAD(P)/FAD-dependent oxidoreductase [Pseudomonadota bacterium]
MKEHHLVVVGAGFAGLSLVKALRHPDLRITLIDKRNHHLFQPLLYQVATTILPPSDIAWPIRGLFRNRKDVTTLLAEVEDVNTQRHEVRLTTGAALSYDTLVIATGAQHSYFGHDAWSAHAPGLKALEDATTIRRRMLRAFEQAELTDDMAERHALLTFAIVGAGPTGVELAGIISELARMILPQEFRRIDTRETEVLLIEAGPRILAAFPEGLSAYANRALDRLGVTVRTGHAVTEVAGDGIVLDGKMIPARNVIWAAGVAASPAGRWLNAETDRAGRVVVGTDLSVAGHDNIFVLGDTAHALAWDGNPAPGIAPAAKQAGFYTAKVIRARLTGRPAPPPFRYRHMGNHATIGRNAAIADFGRVRLTGWIAWWVWGMAHIYFLIGTRSRAAVAIGWFWTLLSGQYSARLITQRDDPTTGDPSRS